MKLSIVGHSYVKDLFKLGNTNLVINQNLNFDIHYHFQGGATFDTYLSNPAYLTEISNFLPDVIIIILGGNDIVKHVPNSEIYQKCRELFALIKETLPECLIIASEIEKRFYTTENRWNSPLAKEFHFRSRDFNNFLKRNKQKHCILQISGPHRLGDQTNYRDNVHLNSVGLNKLFYYITQTVQFCYNKHKQ